MRSFSVKTPDVLPEHFVGFPVTAIQFKSEILPRLHFDFLTIRAADCHGSAYRVYKEDSVCF